MSDNIVITRTSDTVITKEHKGDILSLERVWYPLKGHANHVTTYIEFYIKKKTIEVWQTNIDWDGTGSKRLALIKLNSSEFQSLLDVAKNIKTEEDFDTLVEKVFEVEKQVDEQIDEKFNAVIDELIVLYGKTKLREILNDREQVREILTTYALEE